MTGTYLVSERGVFYTFTSHTIYADAETFRQVGDEGPVAVDKGSAYWGGYRFEADPASLTCVLPGLLYKDDKAVYTYGAKLGRTDPLSFRLLSHPHPCLALATDSRQRFIFESLTGGFMTQPEALGTNPAKLKKVLSVTRAPAEDDESLWMERIIQTYMSGAPPDKGEETAMIVRDGECMLQTRQRVPCHAGSFVQVSDVTGRDRDQFFWGTTMIPAVDACSAEHIDDVFYRDAHHVFCLWGDYLPIPNADPGSFRFIEPPSMDARYAVDDKAGYCLMYGSQRMKVKRFALPDPSALRVTQAARATDGITTFEDGVPIKPSAKP